MIEVRKSENRGQADQGWLKTAHSFSFAHYFDPDHMGFRDLRVINEDLIQPAKGFGSHGHEDMEIISYVLKGALAHKDSMGNGSTVHAGEVQYMSAGKGVTHSEMNASETATTHLVQIWIRPNEKGLEPRYDQRKISLSDKQETLKLLASGNEKDDAIHIRQDAKLYASILEPGQSLEYHLEEGRGAWFQVIHGAIYVNQVLLRAGDGAAVEDETSLKILAEHESEFLMFDLV